MDFTQLKKYLSESALPSAFLIQGEDDFLRESAVSQVLGYAVKEYKELNIDSVASDITPSELYAVASTFPFMSDRRAVVLSEYYPKASDINQLKKMDFSALESSCVIIISNKKTSSITEKVLPNLTSVDCNKKESAVVSLWIRSLLKASGKEISQDNAIMLAEYCGRDMSRVKTEIAKLKNYSDKVVERADIENIVSKDTEYEVYMFANFVIKGNADSAYAMAENFSIKGSGATVLISMLYKQYRRILYSKDTKLTEDGAAKLLGIKPYAVKMLRKDCATFSVNQIIKCLTFISDAEYAIKSGQTDSETGFKKLLAVLLKRGII